VPIVRIARIWSDDSRRWAGCNSAQKQTASFDRVAVRDASDDPGDRYFFVVDAKAGRKAATVRLGAAAVTLIFSFLGFLVSRLPLC
jgi:hypothetical protein